MTEKHSPHLSQFVNASAHRLSFWHSVVCPSDSAHSRQYEITPELDFLHGSTSHRGHPGPGLHFITLSPLVSAGSSSPFRQYSPSSSLLSNGQEYPHPSSSIGGISTAREKECLPLSSCRAPQRLHSQSSKYSRPSIVFINHQKQQLTSRFTRTATPPVNSSVHFSPSSGQDFGCAFFHASITSKRSAVFLTMYSLPLAVHSCPRTPKSFSHINHSSQVSLL